MWKGTLETGSEADIDRAIDTLKTLDVDFVKITDSTLKPELFLYAVSKARAAGLKTSGHIPMALTVRQAVDAGISSIEHLDYAFKAGVKDEAAIAADFAAGRIDRAEANRRLDAGFDRATAMDAYRYLAEKGVFVTPTLNGGRIIAFLDQDTHQRDQYLAYIGPKLRKTYEWRVQRAAQADAAAIAQRHAHYGRVAAGAAHASASGCDHPGRDRRRLPELVQLSGSRTARRTRALRGERIDASTSPVFSDPLGPGVVRPARRIWRDQRGQGRRHGAARPQSAGGHQGHSGDPCRGLAWEGP